MSFTNTPTIINLQGRSEVGMGWYYNRSRRALSTVVTGVIMISAVVVMGAFVVSWANSSLFARQTEIQSTYSTGINKLNERIVIENVWYSSSPSTINITLNNVGSVGLNITEVRIDRNSQNLYKWIITDGGIYPGKSLFVNKSYTPQGNPIDIIVSTDRDNYIRTQVSP